MSDIRADHAVLKAGRPSAAGEALRRRLDRNHLLVAVAAALLIHLLIVLSFWLIDLLRVRDIGEWTGPVVVKIGAPEAPDLPVPDDPTAEIEAPLPPETPVPPAPESPEAGETAAPVPEAPAPEPAVPEPVSTPTATPTTPVQPAAPAAPQPSRVLGEETGNSYVMSFDGTDDEVSGWSQDAGDIRENLSLEVV